jgi:hypothetical protein
MDQQVQSAQMAALVVVVVISGAMEERVHQDKVTTAVMLILFSIRLAVVVVALDKSAAQDFLVLVEVVLAATGFHHPLLALRSLGLAAAAVLDQLMRVVQVVRAAAVQVLVLAQQEQPTQVAVVGNLRLEALVSLFFPYQLQVTQAQPQDRQRLQQAVQIRLCSSILAGVTRDESLRKSR